MTYKFGVVTQQGKPRKALLQLLAVCNVQHDGTLKDIVRQTQKEWLRPKGREIWQVPEKKFKNEEQVRQCLIKLGCFQRVMPSKKSYDRVVIFGGLFERMLERFVFAWKQLKAKKIQTKQVVFLVGERKLDHDRENYKTLMSQLMLYREPLFNQEPLSNELPADETDFPEFIFFYLKVPPHLMGLQCLTVRTPAGSFGRPQTSHTIAEWLEKYEFKSRKCLFVSSSPYIGYQDAVVRRVIAQTKREMTVETVGPANDDSSVTACLDAVARWLYEEQCLILHRD